VTRRPRRSDIGPFSMCSSKKFDRCGNCVPSF
jgi:hypothetical protein